MRYSVTFNFFVPQNIRRKLESVKLSGKLFFDWTKTDVCHCTIKTIYAGDNLPPAEIIEFQAKAARSVLARQRPFDIKICGISRFPDAIFAGVQSQELGWLHRNLCAVLPAYLPHFENNNYIPHVSIAIPNSGPIEIESPPDLVFGEFLLNEIQLVIWDRENLSLPEIHKRFSLT
jgi:2'-5' RNA ligase